MKKIILMVLVMMVLAAHGYCQETAQMPKEFGGIISGTASVSATVESIDYTSRAITLKNEQGEAVTFQAGPEVRNFAQINKGDKVNVDYSEAVKILVRGITTTPEKEESLGVARAALGEKPAGLITHTMQGSATVEGIDYEKRLVTLKGPQRTVTVQVDEIASNFDKVKVGDTVYVEYTELLAISVTS